MNHIQQWFQFFNNVSCFYREMFMLPLWNKYPNHTTDIWDSLGVFLEGYAFERQGGRPDFFHAAVDSLLYCKQQNNGILNQIVVNNIWQQFSLLLKNQSLNIKNNCLYPAQSPQQKNSVIQVVLNVVLNNTISQQNYTLTTYLIDLINQKKISNQHLIC